MEIEDDRFVDRKQAVEIAITQTVGVLAVRLQLEEVNDIDEANLQIGEFRPQQRVARASWSDISGAGQTT